MDKIVLALGEYAVQLWKSAGLPHAKNATNFLKQSPAPTGQSRPDGNFPPGGNNGEKMGCLERWSNGRPGWRGTRPQAHRRQLSMSARSPRARRISYRECPARGAMVDRVPRPRGNCGRLPRTPCFPTPAVGWRAGAASRAELEPVHRRAVVMQPVGRGSRNTASWWLRLAVVFTM
jgi:hypothetical protein